MGKHTLNQNRYVWCGKEIISMRYEGVEGGRLEGATGGVNGDRGCLRSSCSVPVLACQVSTQVPRVLCLQRTGAFRVNTGVLGIICSPSPMLSNINKQFEFIVSLL